jgi:hypothetical protein
MNKHKRAGIVLLVLLLLLTFTPAVYAGDLEPSAGPDDAGSAMYTLTDIYNRLFDNTAGTKRTGAFTEPGAAPGSTGYTLDEIYNIAIPTQVPKTGQTSSYATGDDGDNEEGIAWPDPRFSDNGDGTVTDNLTGLIWLQNANRFPQMAWSDALNVCNNLADGAAGLTDGSVPGDWRLPNFKELQSLIDFGRYTPALPTDHPFSSVQWSAYWSSTTVAYDTVSAWFVNMAGGYFLYQSKGNGGYVWPVRGGN